MRSHLYRRYFNGGLDSDQAVRTSAVAVGRRNWTFAGSDEGGRRAAAIYTLIASAKLNDVDPQAWLADVLARLLDHPATRIYVSGTENSPQFIIDPLLILIKNSMRGMLKNWNHC